MRLIELDAALKGLENLNAICFYEANEHSKEAYMDTKYMLKALPTVDAVPMDDVFALAIALSKGIEVLELPARVYNALSRSAYYTVADVYVLWKSGNLKKLWNLGDKSIRAVEDRLCEYLPYLWQAEGRDDGTAEKTEKTV